MLVFVIYDSKLNIFELLANGGIKQPEPKSEDMS